MAGRGQFLEHSMGDRIGIAVLVTVDSLVAIPSDTPRRDHSLSSEGMRAGFPSRDDSAGAVPDILEKARIFM